MIEQSYIRRGLRVYRKWRFLDRYGWNYELTKRVFIPHKDLRLVPLKGLVK